MPESTDTPIKHFLKPKVSTDLILETRDIGTAIGTVDARRLHAFLDVKSEFRNWIKNRIIDFSFEQGLDFTTAAGNYRGGERRDYYITIDMAKELSMVERNAKGKEARRYFIECERKAKSKRC